MTGKIKISTKVAVGFGLKALLIAAMALFAATRIDALGDLMQRIYDHPFTVTREVGTAWAGICRIQALLYEAILDKNPDMSRIDKEVEDKIQVVQQSFKLARERYLGDKSELDEALATFAAWYPQHDEILELARAGKKDQALDKMVVATRTLNRIEGIYRHTRDFALDKATDYFTTANELEKRSITLLALLCGAALAVAAVVGYLIVQSARQALSLAMNAASRLAKGDLDIAALVDRSDETGQLIAAMAEAAASTKALAEVAGAIAEGDLTVPVVPRSERDTLALAMRKMLDSLSQAANTAESIAEGDLTREFAPRSQRDVLGKAIASMVANLRGETAQIMDAVNRLASSSEQILSSTSNLSSLSSETATAVSQTTATMEEVKQTATMAADRAGDVAESAQQAVEDSEDGQERLEMTFTGLTRIKEQMASIAGSILSLTEKSQAIGEIILAVGDLADQSNILAVNAAIEAAKAGEHGRGFSVVAEEIRNLADQSKQATAQVRSMLGDIQKATSAVVMTVEQGDKAVESVLTQSSGAKTALSALAGAISASAQAAAQIAASSQEQLAGTDQVVLAMESIREASSQQAHSARQLDIAAKDLKDLGGRLKTLLGRYKV